MSALPKDLQVDDEATASMPVSEEALRLAREAVREFPGCFWFRHPEAAVRTRADVLLVMRRLRENGGPKGWMESAKLLRCL